MAKKSAPKGQLGDWLEEVPEVVQNAADEFDKAHVAKGKASGKLNTAKEVLIEKMREAGVKKVRVRNGEKVLKLTELDKITYAKPEATISE